MKRWLYPAIILFTSIIFVLGGCQKQVSDEAEAPVSEENFLTIAMWDYSTSPYYQQIIEEYEKRTGNTVHIIDIASNDYIDKLSMMLYSNQELDVILAKDIPSFVEMIRRHQLEPLDEYIKSNKTDLSGYHGLTDQVRYEGELYGLPFRNDYYVLLYNKDIFDAAGMEYPSNDMTWDEFRQMAKMLTNEEKGIYGTHLHTWRTLVQNWAIQDGEHTVVAEDYSFMKPAYEMALGMQNEDKSIMDFAELKAGNIHYRSIFHNGYIAMIPMGSWLIQETISAIDAGGTTLKNWGVAKLPHQEGMAPGYTMGASTQAGINARSEKKEMAYEFLEFLCGKEGARILSQNGAIPAWSDGESRQLYAAIPGFPQECLDALDMEHMVLESPVHKDMKEIDQILTEEHEAIMTGEKSIDQGLEEMGNRVREMLKE